LHPVSPSLREPKPGRSGLKTEAVKPPNYTGITRLYVRITPRRSRPANESQQLCAIQRITTHDAAVEQQHRDFQPKSPYPIGIAIDIDDGTRRESVFALELRQVVEHGVAQAAAIATDDNEARGKRLQ
jgi:hypothetical protein